MQRMIKLKDAGHFDKHDRFDSSHRARQPKVVRLETGAKPIDMFWKSFTDGLQHILSRVFVQRESSGHKLVATNTMGVKPRATVILVRFEAEKHAT